MPGAGFRKAMIQGVLSLSASAFANYNQVLSEIIIVFEKFFKKFKSGKVFPEIDIFFTGIEAMYCVLKL